MKLKNIKVIDTNRSNVTFVCNVGAAVARGKYINFLHDDDYLLPGGLCALIHTAEKTGCRWIIGSAQVVDDKGGLLSAVESRSKGNLLADLLAGESPHMSYCLLERQTFLDVGGFDPAMKIYEDRDLCWRLAIHHDVHSTDQVVACVRVSGSPGSAFDFSTIGTFSRMIRERILSAPDALRRVQDSARRSVVLRGRVSRQCVFSAMLNLQAGQIWTALNRLTWCCRVTGLHFLFPGFWRGVLLR